MRHQELRLGDQALEPFLLQMLGRELAQQHRHFPVLHHLVGKAGIAARDLFRNHGEGLDLGALLQLDAAVFLRHAERADADLLGALRGYCSGSRSSGTIDHSRCQFCLMKGRTTSSTKSRQLCRIMRCSSDRPRSLDIRSSIGISSP